MLSLYCVGCGSHANLVVTGDRRVMPLCEEDPKPSLWLDAPLEPAEVASPLPHPTKRSATLAARAIRGRFIGDPLSDLIHYSSNFQKVKQNNTKNRKKLSKSYSPH